MISLTSKAQPRIDRNISPYVPLLGYLMLALLVAVSTYQAFERIARSTEEKKLQELGEITDTKVGQITAWRSTLIRRGEALVHGSLLAIEFDRWQQQGLPSNGSKFRIQQMLSDLRYVGGNKNNVLLLDRFGRMCASSNISNTLEANEVQQALHALVGRKVVFSDLHMNRDTEHKISIDLIVPLFVSGEKTDRDVGVLVMQIDPYDFLYQLIQTWPTHSASAETLLIRREGNDVLFLNELRFKKDAALSLRLPLTTAQLPAAKALRGEGSTTQGIDYRGIPVVSEMREVPGTSWFVVSKIDKEELFAPINQLKTWMTISGLVFLLLGGGVFWIWYKQILAQHNLLKAQHDTAVEREMLVKHFESLNKYASDIIMVADETGRIVEANERAVETYGYSREELLQMNISDFRAPNEDPAIIRKQIEQLNERGELHYEAIDRRKDGTIFFIEVSARVIEVQGVKYLQGIVRDVTERKQAENALRKSEALLNSSQQMAHIGSWDMDLINNILSWSEENYRIFEIDPASFGATFEAFLSIVHPHDRAMVEKAYTESVKNKSPYNIEHRLLLPDQRVKYVREWCETHYDKEGRPIRSIGTTQDITEQQIAKRKIYRLNKFYAAISKANEAIVRIRDRDTLLDEICRIAVEYGRFKLAWIGLAVDTTHKLKIVASSGEAKGYLDNIHVDSDADNPEGRGTASMAFRQNRKIICNDFFDSPHIFPWQENAKKYGLHASASCPFEFEGHVVGALTLYAGEANYFDEDLSSLLGDITNDISLALGNFVQEERRKQADEMLHKSAKEIEDLYNNAPCGYHSLNEYGVIVQINDTELRWLGYTRKEVLGKMSIADLYNLKNKQKFLSKVTQFENNGLIRDAEIELICKDGTLLPVVLKATAIYDEDGNFVASRSTLYDNTERKLVEKMREEMEHIGRLNIAAEMASGMAHELSQPLTACNNYLAGCLRRMQEKDWDKEQIVMATQLAYKQSERAGKIINHLKDLVRKNESERIQIDVNQLAREALMFLENEINNYDISVHLTLSGLPLAMASRVEIGQIILNLCKNAIEAMQSCPQRELHVTTGINESGHILVSVSDTGRGISLAEFEDLFLPFQTSKKDGLGLGLSICRSFIEKHGGRIWANPDREAGAEFCFFLPIGMRHE